VAPPLGQPREWCDATPDFVSRGDAAGLGELLHLHQLSRCGAGQGHLARRRNQPFAQHNWWIQCEKPVLKGISNNTARVMSQMCWNRGYRQHFQSV
jgi:hypothetical protein